MAMMMSHAGRHRPIVRVLMMRIVLMLVLVFQRLVGVLMHVALGEMQPDPDARQ